MTDLNRELDRARSKSIEQSTRSGPGGVPSDPASVLRQLCTSIPGGGGGDVSRDIDAIERIRAGPAAGGKNPEEMSPQELHAVLWQVLTFRDSGALIHPCWNEWRLTEEYSCEEDLKDDREDSWIGSVD